MEPVLPRLREHAIIMLRGLGESSGLYPQHQPCVLKDVRFESLRHDGALFSILRGKYGRRELSLKVFQKCEKSDVDVILQVGLFHCIY